MPCSHTVTMVMGKYYGNMNQQNQRKGLWKTMTPSGHAVFSKQTLQNDGLHFASYRNWKAGLTPLATAPLLWVNTGLLSFW